MRIVALEALLWKTFPKSMIGGLNVIALTVNTALMWNFTGST
jgi:hypothetical protein